MAVLGTKRIPSPGFLLTGFTFTVTQGLLIRELLVAFFGNELSIGLVLVCSIGIQPPIRARR
jgi:hypothetical protein